jgi:hypothetical protein
MSLHIVAPFISRHKSDYFAFNHDVSKCSIQSECEWVEKTTFFIHKIKYRKSTQLRASLLLLFLYEHQHMSKTLQNNTENQIYGSVSMYFRAKWRKLQNHFLWVASRRQSRLCGDWLTHPVCYRQNHHENPFRKRRCMEEGWEAHRKLENYIGLDLDSSRANVVVPNVCSENRESSMISLLQFDLVLTAS